jgi:hypothetical protein
MRPKVLHHTAEAKPSIAVILRSSSQQQPLQLLIFQIR